MSTPNRSDMQPVVLAETRFMRLVQQGHWTFAQRPNIRGAIAIVAVTSEEQLVLVEQHRIPVGCPVIELPAGLVGDIDEHQQESIFEAAARELHEETGFQAERFELLTHAVSSAGLSDESIHLLRAHGPQRVGEGGGDASESIETHLVPLAAIDDWLAHQQRQGKHVDYKVYAALYFLARPSQG